MSRTKIELGTNFRNNTYILALILTIPKTKDIGQYLESQGVLLSSTGVWESNCINIMEKNLTKD